MKVNIKKILGIGIFSLYMTFSWASPAEKGIEFNQVRMYESAKIYLLQAIKSGSVAPETFYYLGDTYLMLNKVDSASYYFKKSLEVNPEYTLAMVGDGKKALKENKLALAKEIFAQAIKKDKKNAEVYTAIAAAYIEYGHYEDAIPMYEKARDVKKNYSDSFVVEGDMFTKRGNAGDAIAKYEQAIYFDSNNKQAYLKEARVYKNINTTMSLEILDKLTAVDVDYVPAYIEYADIYYTSNFKKALEAYEKFIHIPGIPVKEVEKYATVLYFSKEYLKSLEQVKIALKVNPSNFVMKRIEMYNNYELENNSIALALGEKFFASKGEKNEYIGQDYITYGRLLQRNKQDLEAIPYLEKALTLDTTNVELYKEISSAYEKTEQYSKSIEYFQKYMTTVGTPKTSDFYNFGRSYYQAGTQMGIKGDTILQKEYLGKAVEMFHEVTIQNADSYLGFLWEARALASLDPELKQGLAKPAYEQTLSKLLASNENGKRSKDITECYMYLGNYYYLNNDKKGALEYFNKALELNPDNEALRKAIKEL